MPLFYGFACSIASQFMNNISSCPVFIQCNMQNITNMHAKSQHTCVNHNNTAQWAYSNRLQSNKQLSSIPVPNSYSSLLHNLHLFVSTHSSHLLFMSGLLFVNEITIGPLDKQIKKY